ncbi:MAG: energy-coupling factor ABC transporter substrate-binding protein [Methanothrix sp.]|jgi:cobalt/nickel transport protein|nr:energy-coupling factor ABC transporter substrate-binding protein [Methanothrix sp.]
MKMEFIVAAILVVFIGVFAYVSSTGNHEWSGADVQAGDTIDKLTGGTYHPWFQSIYTPPSGEIESLLFALQAAFGAIIIGYFLGYYRGLARTRVAAPSEEQDGELSARPAR